MSGALPWMGSKRKGTEPRLVVTQHIESFGIYHQIVGGSFLLFILAEHARRAPTTRHVSNDED